MNRGGPHDGAFDRLDQVAYGLGLGQHAGRQLEMQQALDAQHQLGPADAVDAEVAVEPAGRRNDDRARRRGMEVAHEPLDDADDLALPLGGIAHAMEGRVCCRFNHANSILTPAGATLMHVKGRPAIRDLYFDATLIRIASGYREYRVPECSSF